MVHKEQQLKSAANTVGSTIKEEKMEQIKAGIEGVTKKGESIQKKAVLSEAMIEGIYSQAYQLYNIGKYEEAIELFKVLIMANPSTSKFAMGLAASFHMLKNYKDAIKTYTLLNVIDSNNPVPFYHASDCYVQLKDPLSALVVLKMAVKAAGEKPEFRLLKEKALMMINSLNEEVGEQYKT